LSDVQVVLIVRKRLKKGALRYWETGVRVAGKIFKYSPMLAGLLSPEHFIMIICYKKVNQYAVQCCFKGSVWEHLNFGMETH
jgi:hypothetical protein